jgi:hypothetical protein
VKPFRYTANERIRIRELLPLTPPCTQTWSSPPLRLPTVVPSGRVQVQTVEWALTTLEQLADMFLVYERDFRLPLYTYRDLEEALNRAHTLASQTLLGADKRRDDVDKLAKMAREAKAYFDARYRQRYRRTNWARDWYVEKLLFVWESCGGATHTSGPTIDFILCASSPVFAPRNEKKNLRPVLAPSNEKKETNLQASEHKPFTAPAAREIVRKLLKERRPN